MNVGATPRNRAQPKIFQFKAGFQRSRHQKSGLKVEHRCNSQNSLRNLHFLKIFQDFAKNDTIMGDTIMGHACMSECFCQYCSPSFHRDHRRIGPIQPALFKIYSVFVVSFSMNLQSDPFYKRHVTYTSYCTILLIKWFFSSSIKFLASLFINIKKKLKSLAM